MANQISNLCSIDYLYTAFNDRGFKHDTDWKIALLQPSLLNIF